MRTIIRTVPTIAALCMLVLCGSGRAERAGEEILYPGKDFSKLDTFEALNLEDADKLYVKQDYTGAYAAYKAYSFEFAKSPALPYVLLRMGRCLHRVDKRHEAIRAYQDVVDYFPDSVSYAAAALYYIGECHGQNGDDDKKIAVWARMVKDDDYVAQPNSGTALIYLAAAMDKLEKFDEATEYRWRTAVNFAQSNPGAATEARNAVIFHYVRRRPNHDKLKEFFKLTNAFGDYRGQADNPENDVRYWTAVFSIAVDGVESEERANSCRYWSGKFGNLFPENDDLRRRLFWAQLLFEKDPAAWQARMNKQFAAKPVSIERVRDWLPHFRTDPKLQLDFAIKHAGPLMAGAKLNEKVDVLGAMEGALRGGFYAKCVQPTLGGFKQEEKVWFMGQLRHPLGMHDEAQSVLRSLSLEGLTDEQIMSVGMFAANYLGEEDVLRYFAKIKDAMFATKARFDYYLSRSHRNRPFQEKALAEIPALKKDPKYAGEGLVWTEASLLHTLGRYEEAIKAYNAANRQPDSTWAVTDCLVALKQYGEAIKNVQGLESIGGGVAAQACLKVADIYRIAADKGREVDQLQLVLRRYPKSAQSSEAHQRLENYGVKVIGGEDKAEE